MNKEYVNVKEIVETNDLEKVNSLLKDGGLLLGCFIRSLNYQDQPTNQTIYYSIGIIKN